jgi:putative endonuclease
VKIMFFVYVIRSKIDGRLYKGITRDLEVRVAEHNKGRCKSTKGFVPWELVYFEKVNSRQEARQRELYLKSGSGREFLHIFLNRPRSLIE